MIDIDFERLLRFILPLVAVALLITTAIINYTFVGYNKQVFMTVGIFVAILMIVVNEDDRQLAITVGLICAGVDFIYETIGIMHGSWDYAGSYFRIFGITPIELPIIYFSLGVMLVFIVKWLDPYLD